MTIANQKNVNIRVYGVINETALEIVTVSFLSLLYIWRKPIKITKYVNSGVIPFNELSAALNTTCENSGVKELCINIGTNTGDNIAHFVDEAGTNKLDNAITAKDINIKTIPVSSKPLIILVT